MKNLPSGDWSCSQIDFEEYRKLAVEMRDVRIDPQISTLREGGEFQNRSLHQNIGPVLVTYRVTWPFTFFGNGNAFIYGRRVLVFTW